MNKWFIKFLSYFIPTSKAIKAFRAKMVSKTVSNKNEYFSQFGEDIIMNLLLFFLFSKNSEGVKYLDIGDNDPMTESNTFYFTKEADKVYV